MFRKLKIKTKLLATFISVSLIPLIFVTFIAINKASQALEDEAIAKFTAVQEAKRNHIKDYFTKLQTSVKIIKNDPYLQASMATFNDAFEQNGNTVKNSTWETMVGFKEPPIKAMVKNNGFYDLLLISTAGNIVYTVAKGADLGLNIQKSELSNTSLGKTVTSVIKACGDDVLFADFEAYALSKGEQAAFMVACMIDEYEEIVGYVAVRIPSNQLNGIIQQRSGMGETGESYLVGESNGMTSLRSDRLVKKKKIGTPEANPYIELAIKGESGVAIKTDNDGLEAFFRYDPLDIPGLKWAMITTAATDEVFAAIRSLRNTVLIIILVVTIGVIAAALGLTAVIFKPIQQTVAMLKDIAEGEGDLTKRLKEGNQDEMGEMASWFNIFMGKIQEIIGQIIKDATKLNDVSSSLSTIAGEMTVGVESMSRRSNQAATASDEMSSNMNNVAISSEEASENVNIIAAATEEMTTTVSEIAQNSENARAITETAVLKAVDASAKVEELGKAANEISKVTEVINDISGQTNLLALNATIEAARAGEAGKGFAVVASEIKELAAQTAKATLEIKNRIEGIQNSTSETVTHIEEISDVINGVNEIVTTIAASVEEQSVTSQEIANNVGSASQGIQNMSENVTQNSGAAKAISQEILAVNTSVREIEDSSNDVRMNSDNLSTLADKLHHMVGRFKV